VLVTKYKQLLETLLEVLSLVNVMRVVARSFVDPSAHKLLVCLMAALGCRVQASMHLANPSHTGQVSNIIHCEWARLLVKVEGVLPIVESVQRIFRFPLCLERRFVGFLWAGSLPLPTTTFQYLHL